MFIGHREEIGQRVREARLRARLTIKELAQKINVPQNALSKMELYGQGISADRIEKTAQMLGVPIEELLARFPATDMNDMMSRRREHNLLELPVFEEILRESPQSVADQATRHLVLPALTPLDDIGKLYVWTVDTDSLPEGLVPGDHVVIQWRKILKPQNLVGRMVVGYHQDGQGVVGRIATTESGYQLQDGLPKGNSVPCSMFDICGVIRWGWREF